jgi:hypothetical protein
MQVLAARSILAPSRCATWRSSGHGRSRPSGEHLRFCPMPTLPHPRIHAEYTPVVAAVACRAVELTPQQRALLGLTPPAKAAAKPAAAAGTPGQAATPEPAARTPSSLGRPLVRHASMHGGLALSSVGKLTHFKAMRGLCIEAHQAGGIAADAAAAAAAADRG